LDPLSEEKNIDNYSNKKTERAKRNIRDSGTKGMLLHHPTRKQQMIGTAPNKKPIVTISIFRIICPF